MSNEDSPIALIVKHSVVVLLIIYLIFTIAPGVFPCCVWRNKHVRAVSRFNSNLKKSFGINSEGMQNDEIVAGPVLSYYQKLEKKTYGDNYIVVGLHYTDWCGYCKLMKPVWNDIKKELEKKDMSVVMIENDEDANPTPGIDGYPTIIKYMNGKARRYKGRADKQQLKEFILGTNIVETYGTGY